MAPEPKTQTISEEQWRQTANRETAAGLDNSEVQGAPKLDTVPIVLKFDVTAITNRSQDRLADIFEAPLANFTFADKSKAPSLGAIANHTPDPNAANAELDPYGTVNDKAAEVVADLAPVAQHTEGVKQIFEGLEKNSKEFGSALSSASLLAPTKNQKLGELYFEAEKALDTQREQDQVALEKWLEDNYDNLEVIYPKLKATENAQAKLKKSLEDRLDAQLRLEKAELDHIMQEALVHASNLANARIPLPETEYLGKLYEKYTGLTISASGEHKFTDENRFDRYGNHFTVKDGRVYINLRDPSLTKEQREGMLFDGFLAIKEQGNDTIEINISAHKFGPDYNPFMPEYDKYSNDPRYTGALSKMAWQAAVRAGFEPDKDSGKNKIRIHNGVGNYTPDEEDWEYYRKLRNKQTYQEFAETHPTLHTVLTDNAKRHLDSNIKASALGPDRAAILTPMDRTKLREKDWSKVKSEQDFIAALNEIHSGLGSAIELKGSIKEKEQIIRNLRADAIKNPLLKELLKDATTLDGTYIMDELSEHQIAALNSIPSESIAKCTKPDEVADLINRSGFGVEIGRQSNSNIIDIRKLRFAPTISTGWPSNLKRKLSRSKSADYDDIKDHYLSPKELARAQKEGYKNALTTTLTYQVLDDLKEHHEKVQGTGSNTGLVQKIDKALNEIATAKATRGLLSHNDVLNSAAPDDRDRARELARNYNELLWRTENQLKDLELIFEKLGGTATAFQDKDVRKEYEDLLDMHIKDIDAGINALENAGVIPMANGARAARINFDLRPNSDVLPAEMKDRSDLQIFRGQDSTGKGGEAERLKAEKERILTKIANVTNIDKRPAMATGEQPDPALASSTGVRISPIP